MGLVTERHGATYRKEKIHHVHKAEDDIGDLGLMVAVAGEEEPASDNVMSEHLSIILSPLLDVYHNNLLDPEGELNQNIPLSDTIDFAVWPVPPQHLHVKPIIGVIICVLSTLIKIHRTGERLPTMPIVKNTL